jgi:5-methylcytosine-specific restriction protein A
VAHPAGHREVDEAVTARRPISTARKVAIFLAAKGICHLCGGYIRGKLWEVEHVIPLAMGGADDETNMRPAHKACHAPKTAEDVGNIARAKRREAKHLGIKRSSRPIPGSKASGWRKPFNGPPERRY